MNATAPHDVAVPPAWLGGTFAIGHGRPLFHEKKKNIRRQGRRKKVSSARLENKSWVNRVWKPPPQRAFKSDMLADQVAFNTASSLNSRYTKISAGIGITPVCEQRQADDLSESRDLKKRLYKNRATIRRHYLKASSRGLRIRSTSPRMRFKHDIEEIMEEVEWRLREEERRAREEAELKRLEDEEGEEENEVEGTEQIKNGNEELSEIDMLVDDQGASDASGREMQAAAATI